MPHSFQPNARAWAIARGLVRTGRAAHPTLIAGYICLAGVHHERYWVANDGQRLLRGLQFADAEELQPGFRAAMERAGDLLQP